jgi:hypothetical protein
VDLGRRREMYHHDGCVVMARVGVDWIGLGVIGVAISDMASTISGYTAVVGGRKHETDMRSDL